VAKLGTAGVLLDLTKYAQVRRSEFFPATLAQNAYHGRQWAIPREVGVSLLYVRPDQAAKPPETWEELFSDQRASRSVAVTGDGSWATADLFLNLLYAAGGRLLAPGGHSAVDGPAGRRALGVLLQGSANGTIRTTPDEEFYEVIQDFRRGEEAFLPTESRAARYLLGRHKLDATVAQVPHFAGRPPRPLADTASVAVSAKAKHRGMAVRYLNWLTSPEVMQNAARWDQASPLRESYANGANSAVDQLDGVDAIREALEHAVPYPSSPALGAIGDAIGRNVHRALTGSATAEQALRNMNEEINSALTADAGGDAS
jgi:multiple sugar transport system substrate-binding protein